MNFCDIVNIISYRNADGENLFHEVLQCGRLSLLERVLLLLDEPTIYLLNQRNYEGKTCVHIAASHGGYTAASLISELINYGADLNAVEGCGGDTILHEAVLKSDYILVKWLCKQEGINLNMCNFRRKTAYFLAYEKKDEELMFILRQNGAECEIPEDSDSDTDLDDEEQ